MVHTTVLTAREQKVVRALGGWMLAEVLAHPDTYKPSHQGGRSDCKALGGSHWLDYGPKGITVGPLTAPLVTVRWPKIKQYAKTRVPDYLRDAIIENLRERREHQKSYVPFYVPAHLHGCGRPAEGAELTPAQAEYAALYEEWHKGTMIHHARSAEMNEELDLLLDAAFPEAFGMCSCEALALPHVPTVGLCAA